MHTVTIDEDKTIQAKTIIISGFRPCTPDLKPIIGKSKIENLYIATGHYRNGVLFSAISSDLLLKIVQDKNLKEIEKSFLEKFSLDRFAI